MFSLADCIVRTVLPDGAVPLLAQEVCPKLAGGGSAGPLGIVKCVAIRDASESQY